MLVMWQACGLNNPLPCGGGGGGGGGGGCHRGSIISTRCTTRCVPQPHCQHTDDDDCHVISDCDSVTRSSLNFGESLLRCKMHVYIV